LCWRIAHLEADIPDREYSSRYDKSVQRNSRTVTLRRLA
jgi:hypothetical protein